MKALYVYVGVLLGAAVVLLAYSLLLRTAVWLANRWFGGAGVPAVSAHPAAGEGESRPWAQGGSRGRAAPTIPVPSVLKGMVVALTVGLVQFAITVGCVLVLAPAGARSPLAGAPAVAPPGTGAESGGASPSAGVSFGRKLVVGAVGLTVGFVLWSYLLNKLLPTSFNRAVTVTAFFYGLVLVIWLAVGSVAVAAGVGLDKLW